YVETIKTFTDVKAGQHYVITFSVQNGSGTIPDEFGTIGASGIKVDADIEHEDLGGAVDVSPEKPNDPSERTGNEEWPEEPTQPVEPVDPTDPTKPDQPGQDEKPIDANPVHLVFDEVINAAELADEILEAVGEEGEGYAYVEFTVPAGIKSLLVHIDSSEEFLDILNDPDMNLGDTFDLASPADKKGTLAGLGLPVDEEVKNQTKVVFDITKFISLLCIISAPYEFEVTVTDNNGNQETYVLKFQS
ncbi:MAG: hypothetical protein K2K69_07500, partial [Muribaculaceae bacterium]|nr:hypothetical protein [Muribaculaceae bacterium]